ncbi:MAG: hypothetical protein WKG07_36430 [Hymenobacter sp.]
MPNACSAEDLQKMADAPPAARPPPPTAPPKLIPRPAALPCSPPAPCASKLGEMLLAEGAAAVLSPGRGNDGTVFTTNGAPYAADAKPVLARAGKVERRPAAPHPPRGGRHPGGSGNGNQNPLPDPGFEGLQRSGRNSRHR